MNSMNKFIIVGRLTSNPEIKELENGNKVCNVTLAVDRPYKDKEGNKITDFLPYALWNKSAENICKFSKKGDLISLEGRFDMKEAEINGYKSNMFNPVVESYRHLANSKNNSFEVSEVDKSEEKAIA